MDLLYETGKNKAKKSFFANKLNRVSQNYSSEDASRIDSKAEIKENEVNVLGKLFSFSNTLLI